MCKEYILKWLQEELSICIDNQEDFCKSNYLESGLIDSMGFVQLIAEIEDYFEITMTEEDFENPELMTIYGLINLVEEKQSKL